MSNTVHPKISYELIEELETVLGFEFYPDNDGDQNIAISYEWNGDFSTKEIVGYYTY